MEKKNNLYYIINDYKKFRFYDGSLLSTFYTVQQHALLEHQTQMR